MEDDSDQNLVSKIISFISKKKSHLQNGADLTDEIHDLMDEGQAKGFITDEESEMVQGVLDLKDTKIHSIMIPRTDISSASINATLREFIDLVTNCGHTRIPIYKDNIDEIIGILHAKDLLRLLGEDPSAQIPLDILRKPYFVPGNKSVIDLLKDLRDKKTHIAIVTDEYGGTEGIITIEDIIEEIVGEIQDEHDNDVQLISVIDENSVSVDARLEIKKLEEHLEIQIPEGDFESVGGFIIHILGRIPKQGETVYFQDWEMDIKAADERRIDKVLITRKDHIEPSTDNSTKH